MIARVTRLLLLVQLLLAVLIATGIHKVWPSIALCLTVACGIGFPILIRTCIVANNFRLAAHFPSEPPRPALGWKAGTRLFLGELTATLASSSLTMPFGQLPGQPTVFFCAGTPVLLVHGYGCNSGYWWHLGRRLRRAKISFHAVNLEPVLCDIDNYLLQVDAAVDRLCAASLLPSVIVVAHSMGGLVARAYLRRYGAKRVASLITLGTPHAGTALAQFAIGENARQMRCDLSSGPGNANPWLADLNALHALPHIPIVSIYSRHDNIVAPQCSSHLRGARNIAFSGVGHVALGSDTTVLDTVMHEITKTQLTAPEQAVCRPEKN